MRLIGLILLVLWISACSEGEPKKEAPEKKPSSSQVEEQPEEQRILRPGETPESK